MKRWIIGIFGAALVLSAGYLLLSGGRAGEMVRVYRAGEVLWESPLHRDGVFQAPHNRVEVAGGRVRVSQADCPDQVCVHQGWIADGRVPIVCLPNQLIVQIEEGGSPLDAQTG